MENRTRVAVIGQLDPVSQEKITALAQSVGFGTDFAPSGDKFLSNMRPDALGIYRTVIAYGEMSYSHQMDAVYQQLKPNDTMMIPDLRDREEELAQISDFLHSIRAKI